MRLVVDASVAIQWFKQEADSALARRLLAGPPRLVAPELVVAEVGNACWKASRLGQMTPDQADAAMIALRRCFARLSPLVPLGRRATGIARALGHPVYDAFYVALAERERAPLVTADQRLARAVAGTAWAALVHDLSTFASNP